MTPRKHVAGFLTSALAIFAFAIVATPTRSQVILSSGTVGNGAAQTVTPDGTNLCVGGNLYTLAADDEFWNDAVLNETPSAVGATPPPGGAMWSTQFNSFGRTNNVGIDDAYYTDPSDTNFGGYTPFTFVTDANGVRALNITAEPVPTAYVMAAPLIVNPPPGPNEHWLSGMLQTTSSTYGYYEVNAQMPIAQGYWPLPLALISQNGSSTGQEYDAGMSYGDALPLGTLRFNDIASYSTSNQYDTFSVSQNPSIAFHTYGIMWNSSSVQFYVDRQPVGPAAHTYITTQPMQPTIVMQMFTAASNGGPVSQTPVSMRLQYFRRYAATTTACGPQQFAVQPNATPTAVVTTPIPAATPPAASTAIAISTAAPLVTSTSTSSSSYVLNTAPTVGHTLILAAVVENQFTSMPTGWTALVTTGNLFVAYCIVGTAPGNCPSQTTYTFGSNGAVGELYDFSGASTTIPPIAGADAPIEGTIQPIYRSVTVPQTGGFALGIFSAWTPTTLGITSISQVNPPYFSGTNILSVLNANVNGSALSLRISKLLSEPYAITQPLTIKGGYAAAGSVGSNYDGTVLWLHP